MTTLTHRNAGCTGKISYHSWNSAEKVAKRMRRAHDEIMSPYKCRFCSKFHVGNDGKKRRER